MNYPNNIDLPKQIGNAKLIWEAIKHFGGFFTRKPPDITDSLCGVLNDIMEGKHPAIIAENIGSILRDALVVRSNLPPDQFFILSNQIARSLIDAFKLSHQIWNDKYMYLKELEEVWIAAEPMLDLVNGENGGYPLLKKQLEHAKRVLYFQSNRRYFDDLISILRADGISQDKINKINLCNLQTPHIPPVAIYKTRRGLIGWRGKSNLELEKLQNGKYKFKVPLTADWMRSLDPLFLKIYVDKLTPFIPTN